MADGSLEQIKTNFEALKVLIGGISESRGGAGGGIPAAVYLPFPRDSRVKSETTVLIPRPT
jgi:hypothetical protein